MNRENKAYLDIVHYLRENWIQSMKNPLLTGKNKLYHTLFALAPRGIRKLHQYANQQMKVLVEDTHRKPILFPAILFSADMEIILVDDGSTDGSGELCDSYADRHESIRVLHKETGTLWALSGPACESADESPR